MIFTCIDWLLIKSLAITIVISTLINTILKNNSKTPNALKLLTDHACFNMSIIVYGGISNENLNE